MTAGIATFEDGALIERALAGQKECFDVLIDRHRSAVRRRIRSMSRDTTHEDDLVQEVFLKAWCHLASFRSEASFRTWITRIAANQVLQLHRRECHSPLSPALANLDTFASKFESPHQSLERREARQTIHNAIARLPAVYRQILILRDLEQLSAPETARWLRASIPLVNTRLFRARLLLSKKLQKQMRRVSR